MAAGEQVALPVHQERRAFSRIAKNPASIGLQPIFHQDEPDRGSILIGVALQGALGVAAFPLQVKPGQHAGSNQQREGSRQQPHPLLEPPDQTGRRRSRFRRCFRNRGRFRNLIDAP